MMVREPCTAERRENNFSLPGKELRDAISNDFWR